MFKLEHMGGIHKGGMSKKSHFSEIGGVPFRELPISFSCTSQENAIFSAPTCAFDIFPSCEDICCVVGLSFYIVCS